MSEIDISTLDIYGILGIENGIDATEKQLKLAYNAMALKTHPDRHPDDPSAGERFDLVKRAYEYIRDPTNRTNYNAQLRLREERQRKAEAQDEHMKRMLQRLAEGDAMAAEAVAASRQEQQQQYQPAMPSLTALERQRSTTYIESLQRQGILGEVTGIHTSVNLSAAQPRAATASTTMATSTSTSTSKTTSAPRSVGASIDEIRQRSIVLKWKKSSRSYDSSRATEAGIRATLAPFGEVLSVHIRSTQSDKCKAVVVLATMDQALAATRGLLSDAMFQAQPMDTSVSDPEVEVILISTTHVSPARTEGGSHKPAEETEEEEEEEEPFIDFEATTLAKLRSLRALLPETDTIVLNEDR